MNIKQENNVNAKISDNDIRIMSHNIFLYLFFFFSIKEG